MHKFVIYVSLHNFEIVILHLRYCNVKSRNYYWFRYRCMLYLHNYLYVELYFAIIRCMDKIISTKFFIT